MGYIVMLRARMFRSLIPVLMIKERNIRARNITICIGYHMRGEVISVLSLEGRYHILSRVSAANEGQNMIS